MTAAFIVGFDSEKQSTAHAMIDLIEEAAIPVCMWACFMRCRTRNSRAGLRRKAACIRTPSGSPRGARDQCTMGLNFKTLRPRREILADYKRVLERIDDPVAYAGLRQRLAKMLDNSNRKQQTRAQASRRKFSSLEMIHRIITNLPEPRDIFRRTLTQCMSTNPNSARWIVALMALYLHLGPFSRVVIAQINSIMMGLEPLAIEPRAPADAYRPSVSTASLASSPLSVAL